MLSEHLADQCYTKMMITIAEACEQNTRSFLHKLLIATHP